MNRDFSLKTLAALLVLWAVACVVPFLSASQLALELAYNILNLSAFVVPLIVGVLAARLYRSSWPESRSDTHKGKQAASWILASLGYLLCFVVLARMLEIPWRKAKFGDPVLSLGVAAAVYFAMIAVPLMGASLLLLLRSRTKGRARAVAAASLRMLAFAAFIYGAVGLSQFEEWRT